MNFCLIRFCGIHCEFLLDTALCHPLVSCAFLIPYVAYNQGTEEHRSSSDKDCPSGRVKRVRRRRVLVPTFTLYAPKFAINSYTEPRTLFTFCRGADQQLAVFS